jgi:hypothetical protein
VTLGVSPDQVSVLLNHRSAKAAVVRASLERTLGKPVDVEILFDGARPDEAAVQGNILSLTDPRSEVTKGAETLANLLEAAQPPAALAPAPLEDQIEEPAGAISDAGGDA